MKRTELQSRIWPTKHTRIPDDIRSWQADVVGVDAVVEAAEAVAVGTPVSFAICKRIPDADARNEDCWHVVRILNLAVVEADQDEQRRGYGAWLRVHDADGDPSNGDGSHAILMSQRGKALDEIHAAVAMALYLEGRHPGCQFTRLQPNPFRP